MHLAGIDFGFREEWNCWPMVVNGIPRQDGEGCRRCVVPGLARHDEPVFLHCYPGIDRWSVARWELHQRYIEAHSLSAGNVGYVLRQDDPKNYGSRAIHMTLSASKVQAIAMDGRREIVGHIGQEEEYDSPSGKEGQRWSGNVPRRVLYRIEVGR